MGSLPSHREKNSFFAGKYVLLTGFASLQKCIIPKTKLNLKKQKKPTFFSSFCEITVLASAIFFSDWRARDELLIAHFKKRGKEFQGWLLP